MKTLWTILLLAMVASAQAQSLSVTTVASPAAVKAGGTSTITVTLENKLTPRPLNDYESKLE